ncbi:MAG TPA: hypothetical protein PLE33_05990 [Candidatus Cloacimonas sp.]|nr:hypothetical protein [Candidatus Cloacimonas sp.]HPS60796.1 hypothetical protein [Candidatus Cloacimonas sp.]
MHIRVNHYQKKNKKTALNYFVEIGFIVWLIYGLWIVCYQHNQPKPKSKKESAPAVLVEAKAPTSEPVKVSEPPKIPEVDNRTPRDKMIDKYFAPQDARIMKAICRSENRAENEKDIQDTMNKDKTADIGWCQINVDWNADKIPGATRDEKIKSLQNGEINIQVAHKIFKSWQGFGAWSDYINGRYQKYLDK